MIDAEDIDDKGRETTKLQPKIIPPKEDLLMGLCFTVAAMCKDPAGQESALLVDRKDRWLISGVNFIEQPDSFGVNKNKFGWELEDRVLAMTHALYYWSYYCIPR